MQRQIVQIYEIQTPAEAEVLLELGVDHIGSVLLSQADWRQTAIKETVRLVKNSRIAKSSVIPLFRSYETLKRVIEYYTPDIIHFCDLLPLGLNGTVDLERFIERQGRLKADYPEVRIMRSIPIPTTGDKAMGQAVLRLAHAFEAFSDYFLTDTLIVKDPATNADDQPVEGFIGITGMTCDWDIARQLVQSVSCPVILAGGLDPDNVAGGIRRVNPAGVDSCTGTNARDAQGRPIRFKKDLDRLRRFIEETRRAQNGHD